MEKRRAGLRPDRLGLGEWIIGVASLALLIDVFLPWYSERTELVDAGNAVSIPNRYTATQSYHLLGPFCLLCALLGLIVVAAQLSQRGPALGLGLISIASVLDAILVIWLLIRVVFVQWSITDGGPNATDTIKLDVPAVIGLFLGAVMFWGAWLALRTDGIATADAPHKVETLRLSQRRA